MHETGSGLVLPRASSFVTLLLLLLSLLPGAHVSTAQCQQATDGLTRYDRICAGVSPQRFWTYNVSRSQGIHSAHTVPKQCPYSAHHSAHTVPNSFSWDKSTSGQTHKKVYSEHVFLCVLHVLNLSHENELGTVMGTVWALFGHCMGTVYSLRTGHIVCPEPLWTESGAYKIVTAHSVSCLAAMCC